MWASPSRPRRGPIAPLDNVSLKVAKGEFISIIGHSGCGKSTLLNIVAGLSSATTGGVILENAEVTSPGPDRAVVFQNHSLLPWLSVYDNVRLAVDKVHKGKDKAWRDDWILHNLALVRMEAARDKRPNEISGGMKQRVGIARALAMEPKGPAAGRTLRGAGRPDPGASAGQPDGHPSAARQHRLDDHP